MKASQYLKQYEYAKKKLQALVEEKQREAVKALKEIEKLDNDKANIQSGQYKKVIAKAKEGESEKAGRRNPYIPKNPEKYDISGREIVDPAPPIVTGKQVD